MGICGSKSGKDSKKLQHLDDAEEREKQELAQQRRRLSVAPQHVGQNDKMAGPPEPPPGNSAAAETAPSVAVGTTAAAAGSRGGGAADGSSPAAKDEFVVHSKKGYVPYNRNKVNQDRADVVRDLGGYAECTLYMVCDGHGEFGHLVAEFVKNRLPPNLTKQSQLLLNDTPAAILKGTAAMVDELTRAGINVSFSGTTLVYCVRVRKGGEDRLFVANIGDSRCVLGRSDGTALALSNDQKPDDPKEKARIIKAGGRVEPLPGPPDEDCGPCRVWLAEVDVPGLAMSRSIGDEVSQTVGVISIPEIEVHTVNASVDDFLILASDGVWEFIKSEEACNIVRSNITNLNDAANKLVTESDARWRQAEDVVDDITCILVKLH